MALLHIRACLTRQELGFDRTLAEHEPRAHRIQLHRKCMEPLFERAEVLLRCEPFGLLALERSRGGTDAFLMQLPEVGGEGVALPRPTDLLIVRLESTLECHPMLRERGILI